MVSLTKLLLDIIMHGMLQVIAMSQEQAMRL